MNRCRPRLIPLPGGFPGTRCSRFDFALGRCRRHAQFGAGRLVAGLDLNDLPEAVLALARILDALAQPPPGLHGVWHLQHHFAQQSPCAQGLAGLCGFDSLAQHVLKAQGILQLQASSAAVAFMDRPCGCIFTPSFYGQRAIGSILTPVLFRPTSPPSQILPLGLVSVQRPGGPSPHLRSNLPVLRKAALVLLTSGLA